VSFPGVKRKRNRMKQAMLKEVLEDNLRLLGKGKYSKKRRRRINLLKYGFVFILPVVVFLFLTNFSLFEGSVFKVKRFSFAQSQPVKQDNVPTFQGKEWQSLLSGYRAYLGQLPIPLRRIFGLKVGTIIIDPGHGGKDSGAIGKLGTMEKDITLDIARRLKKRLLTHRRYRVLMTREEDFTLSLEDRVEFANVHGADLYISIHVNYIPHKPFNVIETYYFGPHTDRDSLVLAEKENRGTQYTLSDFKEIFHKIENTLKTQESNVLARAIQKSLYRNIRRQNKNSYNYGVKSAPFVVLLGVDVPSVLAEVTCLSNTEEEKKLNDAGYRKEIARYLEEGIIRYLKINTDKREVHYGGKRVARQTR
jgi:N-acetylmuramoyl-L-alanine amidase